MAIYIRTAKEEFDAAQSNGYVYGQLRRKTVIPVYVELGQQLNRRPSPNDKPNTKYKFFKGCTVYVAETEEQLDNAEDLQSLTRMPDVSIHIYC